MKDKTGILEALQNIDSGVLSPKGFKAVWDVVKPLVDDLERDGYDRAYKEAWQKARGLQSEIDAAQGRVSELEKQEPIGKCLSDAEMGIGYDRRAGPVVWFGTPKPGFIYAAPVAQAGQVPEGVRAWFEAKLAHINAVDAYNARLKFVRAHCPFGTSVDPEYQLMEDADRKARGLIGPMFEELRALLAAAPAQGGDGIDHAWCDGVCDD